MNDESIKKPTSNKLIKEIESLGGEYDPNSSLSIEDQLSISKLLSEDVNVKWNDNGTYKQTVNKTSKADKQRAIQKLKTFTYRTPPIQIAKELERLFIDNPSTQGHWLYIAQNWNPRAINRVIKYMIKRHSSGRTTIKNPAAYFTNLIKRRKKRRSL